MSRMLNFSLVARTFVVGSLAAWIALSPLTSHAQPQQTPAKERPQPENLKEHPVSPQLEQILQDWHSKTSLIKTLEGEHQRWVYDPVFETELRAQGKFFYQSPDKGRIDLEAFEIPAGTVSKKLNAKKEPFQIKSDPDTPQRWICDGAKLIYINDKLQEAEALQIPPTSRGQNIMDGPLPFLLGMPPEMAKKRYALTLVKEDQGTVMINAKPRWMQDQNNFSDATILLDKAQYLPLAVRMMDPAGKKETVFTFGRMKINDNGFFSKFFGKNPYEPDLKGYKWVMNKTVPVDENVAMPAANQNPQMNQGPVVPPVTNFKWADAKTLLEKAGYQVKVYAGEPAPGPELQYVVYQQLPAGREKLAPGSVVKLVVYNKPAEQPANPQQPMPQQPANPQVPQPQPMQPASQINVAAQQGVPSVINLHWKDAQAALEQAGYVVKKQPGRPIDAADKQYTVYEQNPPARTAHPKGGIVVITLYDDPTRVKSP